MARAKYMVDLAEEERVRLRTLLRRGKASVRMVARARVLLRAEEGYTDAAIAAVLDVGTATVAGFASALLNGDWSRPSGNSPDRDSGASSVGSKKPM